MVTDRDGVVVYGGPRLLERGVDDMCMVCAEVTDDAEAASIVLCDRDRCSSEVHLSCLGLAEVPDYRWFCSRDCRRRSQWAAQLEKLQKEQQEQQQQGEEEEEEAAPAVHRGGGAP